MQKEGIVICGPGGSGRGELAAGLVRALGDAGIEAELLDGAEAACRLWPEAEGPGLGRLGWLAALLGRAGVEPVVVAGAASNELAPVREAGLGAALVVELGGGAGSVSGNPLHLAPGSGDATRVLRLVLERLQELGRLDADGPAPYDPGQEELVRRRLKALGYL